MSDEQREQLEQEMHEAAALQQNDPQRVELLSRIVEAGDWAERRWLRLVDEDERIRLDLRRTEVPSGLTDRLRSLPRTHETPKHYTPRYRLAAAASIMLVIGAFWWALLNRPPEVAGSFDTLAERAIEHHLHHGKHADHPTRETMSQVEARLNGRAPFDVKIPILSQTMRLTSGNMCQIDGVRVACTRWIHEGRTYTLFQFVPSDFSLPDQFSRRMIRITADDADARPMEVRFWHDGAYTYGLVADELPEALFAAAW